MYRICIISTYLDNALTAECLSLAGNSDDFFFPVLFFQGGESGRRWVQKDLKVQVLQLNGSAGVRWRLALMKMAKVPTVVKMTKIQRNMRSTTMATYCQSSFSWTRRFDERLDDGERAERTDGRDDERK